MTYEEFLDKLRATPRDWYVNCVGRIRRRHGDNFVLDQCPISALVGYTSVAYRSASETLNIPPKLVRLIIAAADYDLGLDKHRKLIRQDLLAACGLATQ